MSGKLLEHNPIGIKDRYLYDILEKKHIKKVIPRRGSPLFLDNKTMLLNIQNQSDMIDIFNGDLLQSIPFGTSSYKIFHGNRNHIKYILLSKYADEVRLCEYKDRKLNIISSLKDINFYNISILRDKYIFEDTEMKIYIYEIDKIVNSIFPAPLGTILYREDEGERIYPLFNDKLIHTTMESSKDKGRARIYDISTLSYIKEYVINIDKMDRNIIIKQREIEGIEGDHFYIANIEEDKNELRFFDSFKNKTYVLKGNMIMEYKYKEEEENKIKGDVKYIYYLGGNKILMSQDYMNDEYIVIDLKKHKVTKLRLESYGKFIVKLISKDLSLIIDESNAINWRFNLKTLKVLKTKIKDIFPFPLESQILKMKEKVKEFIESLVNVNISDIIAKFI